MILDRGLKEWSRGGLHIFHGLRPSISNEYFPRVMQDFIPPINKLEQLLKEIEQTSSPFDLQGLLASRR